MLDEIKRIIPKMEENDKEVIYHNILSKSEEKKSLDIFKSKFFYAFASLIIVVLIVPVIYIISIGGKGILDKNNSNQNEGTEGNTPGDNFPTEDSENQVISVGNGAVYITHSICSIEKESDILLIKISNINATKLYIKEFDENNSIIDVIVKENENLVSYENSLYEIQIKDLKNLEIEIHYKKQTFENNKIGNSVYLKYFVSISDSLGNICNYQMNEFVIEYNYIIKRG